MKIIVTGGRGDVGSRVVSELAHRGHDVVPASRRTGVDLSTGAGLAQVLSGADAVVHCATSPTKPQSVDVAGARRVVETLDDLGQDTHVVAVSIVGCDRNPYAYYRAKVDTENVLAHGPVPATVLRATQFHALAAFFAGLRVGRWGVRLGDMTIQPVDMGYVASRLADLAEGPPPGRFTRSTDVAGPQRMTMQEVADLVAAHDGRRAPHLFRLPPLGRTLRSFSASSIVPAGAVEPGGETFEQWLARRPVPLPRGPHDPLA